MNCMNKRRCDILRCIIKKQPVKTVDLALKFQVSYRTVMNDLKGIGEFLEDNYVPPIRRSKSKGLYVEWDQERQDAVLDLLGNIDLTSYTMDEEEKVGTLILILLREESYISVERLAEELYISRSTVYSVLPRVAERLEKLNLSLKKKQNMGVRIEGPERHKRLALLGLFTDHVDRTEVIKIVRDYSQAVTGLDDGLAGMLETLFDHSTVEFIKGAVQRLEERMRVKFTETAFATLVVYIGVTIERLLSRRFADPIDEDISRLCKTNGFAAVEEMCAEIAEYVNIEISLDEVASLLLYILGTNISYRDRQESSQDYVDMLSSRMITEVEMEYGLRFPQYDKLHGGLSLHLQPALNRIRYNMQYIDEGVVDQVRSHYPNMFRCVKNTEGLFHHHTGRPVNDTELAYITLHFCAAIESHLTGEYKYQVVAVCPSGIGTVRILESRLQSRFPSLEVRATLSYQDYLGYDLTGVDLIISNIAIESPLLPCIQVAPILTDEDCDKIKRFLDSGRAPVNSFDYKKLLDIVKEHCEILNPTALDRDLREMLKLSPPTEQASVAPPREQAADPPGLRALLTADTVRARAVCRDWQESVRFCGDLLVNQRKVLPRYVEAALRACERQGLYGSYCVISKGIAMPHAKNSDGVIETSMSLITLRDPVEFHHSRFDPVRVVVVFASTDGKAHLRALEELTRLMLDRDKMEALILARSTEEILQML